MVDSELLLLFFLINRLTLSYFVHKAIFILPKYPPIIKKWNKNGGEQLSEP